MSNKKASQEQQASKSAEQFYKDWHVIKDSDDEFADWETLEHRKVIYEMMEEYARQYASQGNGQSLRWVKFSDGFPTKSGFYITRLFGRHNNCEAIFIDENSSLESFKPDVEIRWREWLGESESTPQAADQSTRQALERLRDHCECTRKFIKGNQSLSDSLYGEGKKDGESCAYQDVINKIEAALSNTPQPVSETEAEDNQDELWEEMATALFEWEGMPDSRAFFNSLKSRYTLHRKPQ